MKSRVATLDDTHELARLNAVFNGVQVGPEQLSSRLANPHRVETPIVDGGGQLHCRLCESVFSPACVLWHASCGIDWVICPRSLPPSGYWACAGCPRRALGMRRWCDRIVCSDRGFANHEAQSLYHAMGYEDDRLAVCKTLLGEWPVGGLGLMRNRRMELRVSHSFEVLIVAEEEKPTRYVSDWRR